MEHSSFASGSSFIRGGRGRIRGRGTYASGVHGGAGGLFQASRPFLVGASRGCIGGGFSSGVGLGSGIGASSAPFLCSSSAAGFGAGYKSGVGFGGDVAYSVGTGFGSGAGGAAVGLLGNEKFTMRVLNDRLASYLKKVHLLERANAELELKIRHFVDSRISPIARDYTDSLTTINELQTKILDVLQVKSVVFLNLDNATLAADDFRIKYTNELAIRQAVEADIAEMKRLLGDVTQSIKALIVHIDTLKEDKVYLKKMYQEQMVTTRSQMSGQIHVEVEAAPQENLTNVLEDIRGYYETIAARNRREVEGWFKGKLETLKQEVASRTQAIETSGTEMSAEETKVQSLELELQSILAVEAALGANLSEIQAFYGEQLSGYQFQVMSLEEQLLQLRADLQRQSHDYQMLLDVKTRLEVEIADYRRLLDFGAGGNVLVATGKSCYDTRATTKAKAEVAETLPSIVP